MIDKTSETLYVDGTKWRTPLTLAETRRVGNARLFHDTYARGYYPLEGMEGLQFYRVVKGRLPVMCLQRKSDKLYAGKWWHTWMVDDPLHWIGMGAWVKALPPGKVLCAGLGLGLMLHHLKQREDITQITVVEIDPDVIELIRPTLPEDPRVRIICADYYAFIERRTEYEVDVPDSILWDLAVGDKEEVRPEYMRAEIMTRLHMDVPLYCFGLRFKGGRYTR